MDVEAKVIDTELDTISRAELWLSEASERVAERCDLYKPPSEITTEAQYRDAKAARTQCRKDAQEIDNERKALLRGMEDALKKFKSEVKDVLSPLTDLDSQYKELLDSYDDMLRASREIELAQEYQDLAPYLVELVPFERILGRYGNERGSVWLNKSTNIVLAKQMLADAIERIAADEKLIDDVVSADELEQTKAIYFQTLDLQSALSEAKRLREQRERVQELERIRSEQATVPTPEPVASQPHQPEAEEPVQHERPASDAHPWVIDMVCTREQANMVADFMRSNGIRFNRIYSGTIADAYMKRGYRDA